ncbi:hypothetical protein E1B28_008273 [Marasmius oreades]|uniref:Uncharacterized protein n=1 Tax=Marasmius oreades TaxID=181124 RepID=A0A9P7RY68_9AGAR|nr:uncharacterized protein E1B28_008273 [Marasmius oreades]KAG7091872.1 hypothetical protein E1B28_008273 [Marasmius oreades]
MAPRVFPIQLTSKTTTTRLKSPLRRFQTFFCRFFRKLKFSSNRGSGNSPAPTLVQSGGEHDYDTLGGSGSLSRARSCSDRSSITSWIVVPPVSSGGTTPRQPSARPGDESQSRLPNHQDEQQSARVSRMAKAGSRLISQPRRSNSSPSPPPQLRILHPPPSLDTIGPELRPTACTGSSAFVNTTAASRMSPQRTRSGSVASRRRKEGLTRNSSNNAIRPLRPPPWHYRLRRSRLVKRSVPELQFCTKHSRYPCSQCKVGTRDEGDRGVSRDCL